MGESLCEIDRKMRSCPGWQAWLAVRRIGDSYYAFRKNYQELKQALELYTQPDLSLDRLLANGDLSLERGMREVNRLTCNYCAAAEALQERTRTQVMELYAGHPFKGEFCRKRATEFSVDLRLFMQGLRHFSLHYALPLDVARFTVQDGGAVVGGIELDFLRLREHPDYWKSRGKRYLNSSPDWADALRLFSEHKTAIAALYDWLTSRQTELHKKDFDELLALQQELHRAPREGGSRAT